MTRKVLTVNDPPTTLALQQQSGQAVLAFPEDGGGGGAGGLTTSLVWKPGADTTVQVLLLRDPGAAIPGAPGLSIDVTANTFFSASLSWIDIPGDVAGHAYGIQLASELGNITLNSDQGGVVALQVM